MYNVCYDLQVCSLELQHEDDFYLSCGLTVVSDVGNILYFLFLHIPPERTYNSLFKEVASFAYFVLEIEELEGFQLWFKLENNFILTQQNV